MSSRLYVKKNDKHAIDFARHLSGPFRSRLVSPERLPNHFQRIRHTFLKIYKQFDAVLLSNPSGNRIRPDTGLQINGHKKSALTPSFM
jgi:hypothetical protein